MDFLGLDVFYWAAFAVVAGAAGQRYFPGGWRGVAAELAAGLRGESKDVSLDSEARRAAPQQGRLLYCSLWKDPQRVEWSREDRITGISFKVLGDSQVFQHVSWGHLHPVKLAMHLQNEATEGKEAYFFDWEKYQAEVLGVDSLANEKPFKERMREIQKDQRLISLEHHAALDTRTDADVQSETFSTMDKLAEFFKKANSGRAQERK